MTLPVLSSVSISVVKSELVRTIIPLLLLNFLVPPLPYSQAPPSPTPRLRARELGIHPGIYDPGANNAITDVPGVLVGQTTITEGDNIRTGVTAILPHSGNLFQDKVAGAVYAYNAFGKLAGS